MNMNLEDLMFVASVWALPLLVAITFHEAAHAFVALRLGDKTAYLLGRVNFNPLCHIDFFGTVILPALLLLASGGGIMFGYAKPVPVNFSNFKRPRQDMMLVAIAGPGVNVALALISAVLLHTIPYMSGDFAKWVGLNLGNSIFINLIFAVFNMLPILPLDGGRIAVGFLPRIISKSLMRLERFGFFIIMGGFFVLPLIAKKFGVNLNVFWWLVGEPASFFSRIILKITGIY